MFQPVNHSKFAADLPRNCTFEESDWRILAAMWHPVAFTHEIEDKPVKARLLDVDLVVYRTSEGVSVARDICPHRGTRLSAGWVQDDVLVCPMHGLQFDHSGACTKIPCIGDPNAKIPPKLRLFSVLTEERYGVVFACLSGEPSHPLPVWEGFGDDSLEKIFVPSGTWNAAASRHVENFNDVAHFPWVHKESFGGYESDPIPPYKVNKTDYGLSFDLPYLEQGNRFPDDVESEDRHVTYHYELTLPFSTLLVIGPNDSDYRQYFADTVCPVSAHETRIFQIVTDTTGKPDHDYLIKESLQINDEDKPMVEGQRPEDLPLDLTEEIHIPADRMSVEYRRALAKLGLGAPIAS
ncbi:MAG: aromatic ring-hydroxylating dioxygenase subunit alpha [Oceanospirillales bacterium]|jgi:phenylpropionate dioxygenase-like ring-hydroxylating dioxygenase large terminal subunit|nr:aromatic ring-hydroxylating dioxygenase subunit alpha [Oceanospirillales bacterium]